MPKASISLPEPPLIPPSSGEGSWLGKLRKKPDYFSNAFLAKPQVRLSVDHHCGFSSPGERARITGNNDNLQSPSGTEPFVRAWAPSRRCRQIQASFQFLGSTASSMRRRSIGPIGPTRYSLLSTGGARLIESAACVLQTRERQIGMAIVVAISWPRRANSEIASSWLPRQPVQPSDLFSSVRLVRRAVVSASITIKAFSVAVAASGISLSILSAAVLRMYRPTILRRVAVQDR